MLYALPAAAPITAEAALRITVTKATKDNTISRIIALVEEAETARASALRLIDRFSHIYMPALRLLRFNPEREG